MMPTNSSSSRQASAVKRSTEVYADIDAKAEPALTVVAAVADVTNRSVLDLPPLADTIDPDALNRLFSDRRSVFPVDGELTFTYETTTVTVTDTGVVRVTPG